MGRQLISRIRTERTFSSGLSIHRARGDLIALLRAHVADPHKANKFGQTPIGLARLIDNYGVARYFADVADFGT
jgi:hypothetical protein